jgi:nicotinate-nucleotide--dimethylbenzimidazole phosphoribosyltransferase
MDEVPGSGQAQPIDAVHAEQARTRWSQLSGVGGGFGRLEDLGTWIAAVQGSCPPRAITRPVAIIVGGDHGIARTRRISASDPTDTAQTMRRISTDEAAMCAVARVVKATVRLIDVAIDAPSDYLDDIDPRIASSRIRRGTQPIDIENAMDYGEASAAVELGRRIVDDEIDSGADLFVLGNVGVGATTPASSLIASLTASDPTSVTGRGSGIDDIGWMNKVAAIRDAVHRAKDARGDMTELLARIGGPDIATLSGMLLQAAARRTPVILDGVVVASAALVAHRLDFRSRQWWIAGQASGEPAHAIALDRLDLRPVLDLTMPHEEGIGGLLAIPIVRSAIAVLSETLTSGNE